MFDKINEAKKRLAGIAHRTPVITSNTLNKLVIAEVFLKCESFQRAGAFKFRGAYNAISLLSEKERDCRRRWITFMKILRFFSFALLRVRMTKFSFWTTGLPKYLYTKTFLTTALISYRRKKFLRLQILKNARRRQ